ncbi:unnamed protein product [Ectocarpus sp. CCAP 1310/34]|nr:unnamed protein product [Ectocarpus sp. CCAP 1310/34]
MVIGPQPRCAILAQERYVKFPKEGDSIVCCGRVEFLRPYLARLGLFPPRRNPESAPIRMEELRALVRKWNLHHKRNFWRENPTKDDVVAALNHHIKHMKLVHDHIENKKAERREADRKRQVQNAIGEGVSSSKTANCMKKRPPLETSSDTCLYNEGVALPRLDRPADVSLRPDSIESGIIYMSRWRQDNGKGDKLASDKGEQDALQEKLERMSVSPQHDEAKDDGDVDDLQAAKDDMNKMQAQRKCCLALVNMTMRDQMSQAFLDEYGLLPPLLEITHANQTVDVLLMGLACILNILSEEYKINKLVEAGLIGVARPLSGHEDERVQQHAAGIFLAISSCSGLEEWLALLLHSGLWDNLYLLFLAFSIVKQVQDGAIPALNALARSATVLTAQLATGGLVNIAITLTAAQADSMQRVVMRTVTNLLSGSCDSDGLHFCALAAKNLTVLDNVRAYLDDQVAGIAIDILARLGPGSDDTVILCTAAIFNCAAQKQSRLRATEKNLVAECQRLISVCNSDAQHSCTVLLAELSKHTDVANRLLDGGILDIFSTNLSAADPRSVLYPRAPNNPHFAVAISAAGLSHLAADPDNHWRVLESGNMLTMLLQALILDHALAQRHVLRLLCGLVSNEATQAEVVSAGVVRAVQEMSNRDMHASAISLILFNISCNPSLSGSLLDESLAVPMLVELVKKHNLSVRAACLGALKKLSSVTAFHRRLLERGVLEAVDSSKDVDGGALSAQCAAILYNFSLEEKSISKMMELAGIFLVTHLSYSNIIKTKQLCAAAFCNVTIHRVITDESFLTALLLLSTSTEAVLVLCSAKALSNLSTYPRGRSSLGSNKNVVPALIAMMRSGVKDAAHVQFLSAIALCNVLSVFLQKESIVTLVRDGMIQDLIAVTVLRVEEVKTKETLARAIFNLLAREDTRSLVADQAVFALVRLTRLQSPDLNTICVRAIYNLTCEMSRYGRKLLEMEAERVLVVQASFPNGGVEVKKMCGAALTMMSSSGKVASCSLAKKGIVGALRAIMCVRDKDTLEHVATTAFNLSREDSCLPTMAAQNITTVLVSLHELGNTIVKNLCVATMCNFSSSLKAQDNLASPAAFGVLANTVRAGSLSLATRLDALRTVVNLVTHHAPAREKAVESSTTSALCVILKALVDEEDKLLVSKALRDMSSYAQGHPQMMKEDVLPALVRLAKVENAEIKQDVATALCRLSASVELAFDMVDEGLPEALYWLTLEDLLGLNKSVFLRCSVVCCNVVVSDDALRRVSGESARFSKVLQRLSDTRDSELLLNVAMVCLRITGLRESMLAFHKDGLVAHILGLSGRGDEDVKQICSTALNQVPPDMVQLDDKMVNVLVSLLTASGSSIIGDCGHTVSEPSVHDLKPWSLRSASIAENPVDVQSSWVNYVCQDFEGYIRMTMMLQRDSRR